MTRIVAILCVLFASAASAQTLNMVPCYLSGSITSCFKPVNVPSGGTGDTSFTSNALVVGNGTGALNIVTNNSSATNEFLTQSSSGAPAWAAILTTDTPPALVTTISGTANYSYPANASDVIFTSATSTPIFKMTGTNILAGYSYRIENTSTSTLTFQSGSGTTITGSNSANGVDPTIQRGYVIMRALVNTPTNPGDWTVTHVEEWAQSATFTWGNCTPGTCTGTITFVRNNRSIVATLPAIVGATNQTSMSVASSSLPTRFQPAIDPAAVACGTRVGTTNQTILGQCRLRSNGAVEYLVDWQGTTTFGSSGGTNGVPNPISVSYSD